MAWTRVNRQGGMTLLECVIAIALIALVLSGTSHLLTITLKGYETVHEEESPQHRARQVMDRIAWAMDTATRLKKSELSSQNDPTKSGLWFDRIDPVTSKKLSLEYKWDNTSRVLREKNAITGVDSGILTNVSGFSVTAPDNTEMAVVRVSLTVGDPPHAITLTEHRRLGGAW